MDTGNKGAYNEIIATAWLLDKGYHVFRNISAYGPVDLVAIKNSEVTLIDVKAGQIYDGKRLRRQLTEEQIALGVKIISVYPDTTCILDASPASTQYGAKLIQRTCASCANPFETKFGRFCTSKCKSRYYNAKTALKRVTNGSQ